MSSKHCAWTVCGVLVWTAACSSAGEVDADAGGVHTATQAIAARERPAEEAREITVASEPNVKCDLTSDATGERMSVWADDVGLVHLWKAAGDSASGALLLECEESSGAVATVIDPSQNDAFIPATPRFVPKKRKALPALSNPGAMTQAELVRAGYPVRPDPRAAPEPYRRWLEIVSVPTTIVEPNLVERDDVRFGPATYTTGTKWSGSLLNKPGIRYTWVLGAFRVPSCSNPPGHTSSKAAWWVGLDGTDAWDPVVIQDGVVYRNVSGVGSYTAWHEYYPRPAVENTSMVLHVNDQMNVWAWEGDSSCVNGAGHTGYGCFWYRNDTTGVATGTIVVNIPPGKTFKGTTAEAIVERVSSAPVSSFPLGYGTIQYHAVDSLAAWHNQASDPHFLMTLVGVAGNALVTPVTYGTDSYMMPVWHSAL